MHFLPPQDFGIERLAYYYRNCRYEICEYSVGIKLMYANVYRYVFCEACGCLICRDEYEGITYFDFPVEGENGGDVEGAILKIEEYCLEKEITLRFTTLPADALQMLSARYDGIELQNTYLCRDYIYSVEDVMHFSGKRYAGQRNHIRRFQRLYPGACFRPLTQNDLPALERFMNRFNARFQKSEGEAITERESAFRILHMDHHSVFRAGCMELDGEIIGVALGEKCGDTLIEHIEKALSGEFEGIYPSIFQSFVSMFGQDCKMVNREDDAADKGLRTSKMQYHPCKILQKYDMNVKNVLHFLQEPPSLQTDRLTLDKIRESDANAYGALNLDDSRNRYWGYDYRIDWEGQTPSGTDFCRTATEDFSQRMNLSLAIRLDGEMIGEAVLYRFDNRGGAEIGVRISEAYAHHGYGKEAFTALADWALYTLGVTTLNAKCFRQNQASERMLGQLMQRNGEDEKMLYFVRRI
ncbi:MAG: GNAT family N-acetyltransferase [Clostridia bacterium]|nr:GNAT family N-acetyltransferase [Clostridia bacterium]